ncbi:MAG TPA: alpha-glucuronidase [Cellulomonas sp.]
MTVHHPAWLPPSAFAALGARQVALVRVDDSRSPVVATVRDEVANAVAAHGGAVVADCAVADLVLSLDGSEGEAFTIGREGAVTTVHADGPAGLLYALHHVVRLGDTAFAGAFATRRHVPSQPIRMLDHWDNITPHPLMGAVERGYAGGSIFWSEGHVRPDLSRVEAYARLLAHVGVNAVAVNNVNVHTLEAHLLTTQLAEVGRLADVLRPSGIRTYLSVSYAAPMSLGGLDTADPLDPAVRAWWAATAADVYAAIPDFGGFVVKADSEGQPGPFSYGRDHADGANLLARALAPYGGTVFWRAFVYDHRQDWRDRRTDRARAAYDHFTPLDGHFDDNVVVQVKYGPMDFQPREPVSPMLAGMPRTRLALELQVTQEYTGQQQHVCYLAPLWSDVLAFRPWGRRGRSIADIVRGDPATHPGGGVVGVSNVGDDDFWTGHPLAQANLYAFGRLAWDPTLEPAEVLDEWIDLTFGPDETVRGALHTMMDGSWLTYERCTAPLGVGFMVSPGDHYGPAVDGYEYSPWGTYHFADRDGVGVDRTRATGTGYAGQYPLPWRDVYESPDTCPDELLLFFHHVPYRHVLHGGSTVIQHIYDTHFGGVSQAEAIAAAWPAVRGRVPDDLFERVAQRLVEQVRCAREWRDQLNAYFWRKSGVPDERGRTLY